MLSRIRTRKSTQPAQKRISALPKEAKSTAKKKEAVKYFGLNKLSDQPRQSADANALKISQRHQQEKTESVETANHSVPLGRISTNTSKRQLAEKREEPVETNDSNVFGTESDHLVASSASRYKIGDEVGKGGTAVVYRATDTMMNREIAFKRFVSKNGSTPSQDYLKEIATIARITHPNVVVTHDAGQDASGPFIIMNLIKGIDLEVYFSDNTPDVSYFLNIALQMAEGLQAVHSNGILHLDIKPSNIMISDSATRRPRIQLIDFGLARDVNDQNLFVVDKSMELQGSIYAMSPEQFKRENLDFRSDIYSLGCVFYEALAKSTPFQGDSSVMVMASHLQNKFTPLNEIVDNLPEKLVKLIHSMISLDKESRPDDIGMIIDELNQIDSE